MQCWAQESKGAPAGLIKQVIDLVNDVGKTVLSVDVPSGLNASTGAVPGACIKAEMTVTLAAPKVGLLVYPGAGYKGRLFVADIGIPAEVLDAAGQGTVVSASLVRRVLPARSRGWPQRNLWPSLDLGWFSGNDRSSRPSRGSRLAHRRRSGNSQHPQSLNDILEVKLTEAMTIPLPETTDRSLSIEALGTILEKKGSVRCRRHRARLGPASVHRTAARCPAGAGVVSSGP